MRSLDYEGRLRSIFCSPRLPVGQTVDWFWLLHDLLGPQPSFIRLPCDYCSLHTTLVHQDKVPT